VATPAPIRGLIWGKALPEQMVVAAGVVVVAVAAAVVWANAMRRRSSPGREVPRHTLPKRQWASPASMTPLTSMPLSRRQCRATLLPSLRRIQLAIVKSRAVVVIVEIAENGAGVVTAVVAIVTREVRVHLADLLLKSLTMV